MPAPLYQLKAEFFKTLGHPARIRVLELLGQREHAVSELLPEVGVEAANLSQQLAVLRKAGLVMTRKEGQLGVLLADQSTGGRTAGGGAGHPHRGDLGADGFVGGPAGAGAGGCVAGCRPSWPVRAWRSRNQALLACPRGPVAACRPATRMTVPATCGVWSCAGFVAQDPGDRAGGRAGATAPGR